MSLDTNSNGFSELVYNELRRLANALMRREREGHSLQPTALVHEAYLQLCRNDAFNEPANRARFFGIAACAMRRILIQHARKRNAIKRGGNQVRVPFDNIVDQFSCRSMNLLALDEGLEALKELNRRQYDVVVLRFFGGFTNREAAMSTQIAEATAESDFRAARAFLHRWISKGNSR